MDLQFEQKRMTVVSARGRTDAVCVYEFALVGEGADGVSLLSLTTGLDVSFLHVRPFTPDSLLVLFFTGNPVQPQFVVAEFHYDDEQINHTLDHGASVESAVGDWKTRRPGEATATPPTPADVKAPVG